MRQPAQLQEMQHSPLVAEVAGVADLLHSDVDERCMQPRARILPGATRPGAELHQVPLGSVASLLPSAKLRESPLGEHEAGGGDVVVGNAVR